MIRSFALHDIDLDNIAATERWCFRDHAPEIVRRWLATVNATTSCAT